ncbi:MAG: elongation factor P [Planctomycetota bacterium]
MRASEMKKGQTINIELKKIADGSTQNVRLRSEENIEQAFLDKRTYEYLYSSGSEHVLMDTTNYEQISLNDESFGDGKKYLKPNTQLQVSMYQGKPVIVDLPNSVDLQVTETAPEIKGATATNQYKTATLETGLIIQVPPFIKIGDVINVDTRSGEYVTRVKNA